MLRAFCILVTSVLLPNPEGLILCLVFSVRWYKSRVAIWESSRCAHLIETTSKVHLPPEYF